MYSTYSRLLTLIGMLCFINVIWLTSADEETEENTVTDAQVQEVTQSPEVTTDISGRLQLALLDPIEVGHVRKMELETGKFYEVRTAAVNPPIFLIPDFLTDEESEQIKSLAESVGFKKSKTILKRAIDESVEIVVDSYFNAETFEEFDVNKDQTLNYQEATGALQTIKGVNSLTEEVFEYMLDETVDLNSDRHLDVLEFRNIPRLITDIKKWIESFKNKGELDSVDLKKIKKGPDRISVQTWLKRNVYDASENITNRLIALTGLHPDIVKTSEELQVVNYVPGGHYHAHHDSSRISERPCSHSNYLYPVDPVLHLKAQRMCRYATILYYLAETEEGGQTAFPAADNETYSIDKFMKGDEEVEPCDLSNHCKDANYVVQPRKGLAVLWYNHLKDPETGWLGSMNLYSLHGGCDVIKGEKWIANNWITVDNNYDMQMKLHQEKLYSSTEATGVDEKLESITESNDNVQVEGTSNMQESTENVITEQPISNSRNEL